MNELNYSCLKRAHNKSLQPPTEGERQLNKASE